MLYPIARKALFKLSAERAHEVVLTALSALPRPAHRIIAAASATHDPALQTQLWGIDFRSPVGLAAGLDKAGTAFNALGALGFGFVEIGTITAHAQPGNPKPRLFRLPRDRALLNRMGFNNPGAEAVAAHLAASRIEVVLGINVGKSKVTSLENVTEDYLRSISLLERFARYLVVNVSSPNTPGLRDLQDAEPLRQLLRAVVGQRRERPGVGIPVLLKLAPDLTDSQIDQAVEIAGAEGVAGIVAVNTTISRAGLATPSGEVERIGAGGISGAPLRTRATEVVARIYSQVGAAMPIVGVGGIFNAGDAWERICKGASLVQVYTGFVYEGPGMVKRINDGLSERLRTAGFRTIAEAVGSAHR